MTTLLDIRRLGTERRAAHVPVFVNALTADDPKIRVAACDALGWLRDPAHATPLMTMLEDESEAVRYAATANLALCGSFTPAIALTKRLTSDNADKIRARAARVIGFLGLPEGRTLLKQLERESAPEVLAQIVYALGQLRHQPATNAIAALLAHSDHALRLECIRAMSRLAPDRILPEENRTHTDPHVRIEAIRHLAQRDPTQFCEQAATLFEDPNPGVRCAVVVGLRQLNTIASRTSLTRLPNDPHPEVQRHLHGYS